MANPTLLEMPIARDGAKNSIPSTTSPTTGLLSQQYGWQDINSMPVQQGGKAPSRLDFNGAFNLLSNILFYAQKGWQFEWDSNQAYYAGCVVKDPSDGKMYMCLNDVTSTTAPHSDTTNWKVWDLSMLSNYLPLAGGQMIGAIKGSGSMGGLNMYAQNDTTTGARLLLEDENFGGAGSTTAGMFFLAASDTANNKDAELKGYSNGTLIWAGNDLGGSAIVARTNSYIKYASGLIMQWGVSVPDGTERTFPISFTSDRNLIVCPRLDNTNYWVFFDDLTVSDKLSKYKLTAKTMEGGVGYSGNAMWFAIGY